MLQLSDDKVLDYCAHALEANVLIMLPEERKVTEITNVITSVVTTGIVQWIGWSSVVAITEYTKI
jgi:hypothetical protein